MKLLILAAALLLSAAACATRQIDPLLIPPEANAMPEASQ